MSLFSTKEGPRSALAYHRILAPTAGVRVSPLCLGTMNFGEAWKSSMGECNKETSFKILDTFFEQGGNFIDTANGYQGEESEEWLGEWLASRKNRDQIVLATKFTTYWPSGKGGETITTNFVGNHAKSLHVSLEASLKKLQTTYIDLLYVHWWDFTTSIPELMQSLNRVVDAGKVLYLGISDTPAWVVTKANAYAREHGLTPFSVYQGKWNAATRDFERDILPMCESEGMAIAPWGTLGAGQFRTRAQLQSAEAKEGRNMFKNRETNIQVAEKLDAMSKKMDTSITSLALAYIMHKYPYVYPIIGGRKVEHLKGNIEALGLKLTNEDIDEIEDAAQFDIGFPMNMLFGMHDPDFKYRSRMTTSDMGLVAMAGPLDLPGKPSIVTPRETQ
ncbi:norsolorinic acid reductase-1 [Coleophoma cylindrospora]|uniref:Norsolorinic acid reductase-1 n=1 Tax=Coleophoma cylindrospora TaxID=1849047 RepID=A0A3D8QSX1_9HELO|nr:norsolorinic acid reductase-1 [Coleophoma cylindrospora]